MSDWAIITVAALILAYKLTTHWLDSRNGTEETPPPGNDTLVETMPHDIRDDSERRIPDVRLGFQCEDTE